MNERVEPGNLLALDAVARHGPVRALLKWAADAHPPGDGALRLGSETGDVDGPQLQYIVDAGLAPLLYHALRDRPESIPANWHDVLKSAERTARFAHAALREGANHVVDICRDLGAPVTLLKGISISDGYYPEAHLRPMGDVDLLLSERDRARVESTLLHQGYTPLAGFQADEEQPHGAPLFDSHRRVWIELHKALFHKHARVSGNSLFSPSDVAGRSITSTLDGRPVLRLSHELQLVYIASYWLRDMTRNRMHATLLVPLLDAIYLLKATARSLDWDALLDSLDNEMASASLCILLAQVRKYGFEDEIAQVMPRLAARQRIVGTPELRVMDVLLDSYLVGGRKFLGAFGERHPMIESTVMDTLLTTQPFALKLLALPWNCVFPPRVPERYSARYQLGRIGRYLRGA